MLQIHELQGIIPKRIPVVWSNSEDEQEFRIFCERNSVDVYELLLWLYREKEAALDAYLYRKAIVEILNSLGVIRSVRFFYNHWDNISDNVSFELLMWILYPSEYTKVQDRIISIWQLTPIQKIQVLRYLALPSSRVEWGIRMFNYKDQLYSQLVKQ